MQNNDLSSLLGDFQPADNENNSQLESLPAPTPVAMPTAPSIVSVAERTLPTEIDAIIEQMVADSITELQVNSWANVHYVRDGVRQVWAGTLWPNLEAYLLWLDGFVRHYTDARDTVLLDPADPRSVNPYVDTIEASLIGDLYGSIHLQMPWSTAHHQPVLTIRKQPATAITLDQMVASGMMTYEMRVFLEIAVRGRLNILVAGGTGSGKTTLLRALAQHVDPNQRIVTIEDANELNLKLPNVVPLITTVHKDQVGRAIREVTTNDLLRDALRMRTDRIWVGEVRGPEALPLTKACTTGSDGSITTIHASSPAHAMDMLANYLMEAGLARTTAVMRGVEAFDLVVHIKHTPYGGRYITAITEVLRGVEHTDHPRPQLHTLWEWDDDYQTHRFRYQPQNRIRNKARDYGVDVPDFPLGQ